VTLVLSVLGDAWFNEVSLLLNVTVLVCVVFQLLHLPGTSNCCYCAVCD